MCVCERGHEPRDPGHPAFLDCLRGIRGCVPIPGEGPWICGDCLSSGQREGSKVGAFAPPESGSEVGPAVAVVPRLRQVPWAVMTTLWVRASDGAGGARRSGHPVMPSPLPPIPESGAEPRWSPAGPDLGLCLGLVAGFLSRWALP